MFEAAAFSFFSSRVCCAVFFLSLAIIEWHRARHAPRGTRIRVARGAAPALTASMGNKSTKSTIMDVLDLLTTQHTEVDDLFEKLENDEGDRQTLFLELADKLAAHATIEEKIFYPGVMSKETHELLHESVEEHLTIKRTLADMLTMKLDEDSFKAKLSVLKENVSHHAHEEEEDKLFPILRSTMSKDELAALGNECLAMFEDLMRKHPYRNVPSETAAAAPLPSL
ncbi:MAG: hemerythrin domain-containing protein [Kofleriaceae bacterium]